jgi:acetyl esterase/lipase
MQTILGANGIIGHELSQALSLSTDRIRQVSRYPQWIGAKEDTSKGVIIYLHGVGFTVRAALTDRRFCDDLSSRTGLPVVLVA